MPSDRNIAIIGAGLSGLKCAHDLQKSGFSPIIFEKSRGLGGRIATRRTRSGLTFDHGAQYVTARSSEFKAYLDRALKEKIAAKWNVFAQDPDPSKSRLVGVEGMSDLVRPLAQEIEIKFETTVSGIERNDKKWSISFEGDESKAEFDIVVVTVPAPQAIPLLSQNNEVISELEKVNIMPCLATILAFETKLDVPFETLASETNIIAWCARNSSKPSRDKNHDCWVLHASPTWSAKNLEEDRETIATLMLDCFVDQFDLKLPKIIYKAGHKWRYALTERPLGKDCLSSADGTLLIGGDWCTGARAEFAFNSGEAMADKILALNSRR
jgi:renalase